MDQEICLILGGVSLNLLYWKENLQTDFCGPGGDKTASDIQARSFMARTMDEEWQRMLLREKHKWAIEKPKLDNARRLRGIYFIDPR